MTFAIWT